MKTRPRDANTQNQTTARGMAVETTIYTLLLSAKIGCWIPGQQPFESDLVHYHTEAKKRSSSPPSAAAEESAGQSTNLQLNIKQSAINLHSRLNESLSWLLKGHLLSNTQLNCPRLIWTLTVATPGKCFFPSCDLWVSTREQTLSREICSVTYTSP